MARAPRNAAAGGAAAANTTNAHANRRQPWPTKGDVHVGELIATYFGTRRINYYSSELNKVGTVIIITV